MSAISGRSRGSFKVALGCVRKQVSCEDDIRRSSSPSCLKFVQLIHFGLLSNVAAVFRTDSTALPTVQELVGLPSH